MRNAAAESPHEMDFEKMARAALNAARVSDDEVQKSNWVTTDDRDSINAWIDAILKRRPSPATY
jgi:hypothetical protein